MQRRGLHFNAVLDICWMRLPFWQLLTITTYELLLNSICVTGTTSGSAAPSPNRARGNLEKRFLSCPRTKARKGPVDQTGRSPRLQRGGQGFKSPPVHTLKGSLAVPFFLPWIPTIVVPASLPEPWSVLICELDPCDPFRALPEVQSGDNQSHRIAVFRC